MRTWPYRILSLLALGLFALVWAAAINGWGLRPTAVTNAEREAVRRHSARVGGIYFGGGGTHFGK